MLFDVLYELFGSWTKVDVWLWRMVDIVVLGVDM